MDVPRADQRNMNYQKLKIIQTRIFNVYNVKTVKKFGHVKLLALVEKWSLAYIK